MKLYKPGTYIRHSTAPIDEVIALIQKYVGKRERVRVPVNGTLVNVSGSLRLLTFAFHGTVCACCGMKAVHFAIERNLHDEQKGHPFHLNLWGVDDNGDEVLFTHDHVIARSAGGKDDLSNTQTMCTVCNGEKAKGEQITANLRRAEFATFGRR